MYCFGGKQLETNGFCSINESIPSIKNIELRHVS